MTEMRAVVADAYGPPESLRFARVPVPAIGADQVLVRVRAAGVDPGVWLYLTGSPPLVRAGSGLRRPRRRVPGRAFAGQVEAVGAAVRDVRVGDDVYGEVAGGAYAEFAAVPAAALARMPLGLTHAEAATMPISAIAALQGLRDAGRLTAGARLLVNGASGGVGTYAVQIGRALGADVTAVCGPDAAGLVRDLGADRVVDYTREDFTRPDVPYEVIFDLVGNRPLSDCRRALTPGGALVLSSGPPAPVLRRILGALVTGPFVRQRQVVFTSRTTTAGLRTLAAMAEAGEIRPVLARELPIDEVAEALRRQGAGHARGKTVLVL